MCGFGIILFLLLLPGFTQAESDSPSDGYAGDPPAANTCVVCHDSYELDSGFGGITLSGVSNNYSPGSLYEISIVMGSPGFDHWGFQLTAIDDQYAAAGNFLVLDAFSTVSENPYPQPDYVGQTEAGVLEGEGYGHWTVMWIAPPADTGTITIYCTSMASDGDGTEAGDYVYSTNRIIDEGADGPTGQSVFVLEPNHNFGIVPLNTTRNWTQRVYSVGTEPVEMINPHWQNDNYFTVVEPVLPLTLIPGDWVDFTIAFTPQLTGWWADSLSFGIPVYVEQSGLKVEGQGSFIMPPELFHLIAPLDGETVDGDSVHFSWQSSSNPDSMVTVVSYSLEIDTESDFITPTIYDVGEDTTYAVSSDELSNSELYFWRVLARDTNTPGTYSEEEWAFLTDFVSVEERGSTELPDDPIIVKTWPNPFNEQVTITFSLPYPALVEVEVLDILGRRVSVLHSGPMDVGNQTLQWRGAAASGVYLVRVTVPGTSPVLHKMVFLK